MPRPDEGLIHAWLDGELSPDEAARVERLVHEEPEWAAAAREARGLVAASSRILGELDAVPGDVLPVGSRAATESRSRSASRFGWNRGSRSSSNRSSRFSVRPWMRVAAGLVLVVGTASVVSERIGVRSAFDDVAATGVQPKARDTDLSTIAPDSIAESAAQTQATGARVSTPTPTPTARSSTPIRESAVPTAERAAERAAEPAAEPTSAPAGQRIEPPREVAAVPPSSADAFRSQEMRAVVPTDLPVSGNTRSASGFGSARALTQPQVAWIPASTPVLEGCWRTATTAAADSVLTTPRVLSRQGDLLTILARAEPQTPLSTQLRIAEATADAAAAAKRSSVPAAPTGGAPSTDPTVTAAVQQRGDTLTGMMVGPQGTQVPFRAVRIPCGE